MPILTTKKGDQEVLVTDMLSLVVPPTFARASIHATPSKRNPWAVHYWDTSINKKCCHKSSDRDEAEAFAALYRPSTYITRRVSVADVLADAEYFSKFYRLQPMPVDMAEQPVPLDPTFLGLWLGDGTSARAAITTIDKEVLDYVKVFANGLGLVVVSNGKIGYRMSVPVAFRRIGPYKIDKSVVIAAVADRLKGIGTVKVAKDHGLTQALVCKYTKMGRELGLDGLRAFFDGQRENVVRNALRELNVLNNKHVPDVYKNNSRDVRLKLLGGMIDTDGYLGSGGYELVLANKTLLEDFAEVARSLGFSATTVQQIVKTCTNAKGGPKKCIAFHTRITGGRELREIPILLPRKRIMKDPYQRYDQLRFTITA